jgi:type IV secretory pathway VirB3-like protein
MKENKIFFSLTQPVCIAGIPQLTALCLLLCGCVTMLWLPSFFTNKLLCAAFIIFGMALLYLLVKRKTDIDPKFLEVWLKKCAKDRDFLLKTEVEYLVE